MKLYPDEKIVIPVYLLCTTTMTVPICFIAETNLSAWTLRPDISLAATVLSVRNLLNRMVSTASYCTYTQKDFLFHFQGFFGNSLGTFIHTWGLQLKGPLYISIFRPLSIAIAIAIAAAVDVIFLGEALSLGRYVSVPISSKITKEELLIIC